MKSNVEFDYNKLRGRIVEKVGSLGKYAKVLGISKVSLTDRLMGRIPFNQKDIFNSLEPLAISDNEISEYFFKPKVRKTELEKEDKQHGNESCKN